METVINSILYLFGLGRNPISVQINNDSQSMKSDWYKVGHDIQKAFMKYEESASTAG